jgi:hypothetical protein
MVAFNLGVRFLVEIFGIVALAVWGYATPAARPWNVILAVLAPTVLIVIWAMWIAPKSNSLLSQRGRVAVGTMLLLMTAAALAAAGHSGWAITSGVVIVVNGVALLVSPNVQQH